MALTVTFDTAFVEWIELRPNVDTTSPIMFDLRGQGVFKSSDNPDLQQAIVINGWDGVSDEARIRVEHAVMGAMLERCALALQLEPGQGLIIDRGHIRQARPGEQPMWMLPATTTPEPEPDSGNI